MSMRLTTIGADKLATAASTETTITFAKVLWGNANGTTPEVTGDETALVNQIHETDVVSVELDEARPGVIRVSGVLQHAPEEFILREVGIEDADGDLIAYGTHPTQLVPAEGGDVSLQYNPTWLIVVTSDLAVAVSFQAPGAFATEEWVTANFQPKDTYVKTVTGTGGVVVEGSATARSARLDEAWLDSRYKAIDADAPGVESVNGGTGISVTGPAAAPVINFSASWGDNRYRGKNDPFPIPAHSHPNATPSADGFMSKSDKSKLDGLRTGLPGAFLTKVDEKDLTGTDYAFFSFFNVTGASTFLLRFSGLKLASSPSSPLRLGLGNGSTMYTAAADTRTDHPEFQPMSGASGIVTLLDAIPEPPMSFSVILRHLNSPTIPTELGKVPSYGALFDLLAMDDNEPGSPDWSHPIRAAATVENRLQLYTSFDAGNYFLRGRASLYAVLP